MWWLWSLFLPGRAHLLHRGLELYPEIWKCRARAGQGAEVQHGLGIIKVSSRSGGIMLFQAIIYQMGPLNGKPNYLVVKETLSDLIDI